MKKGNSTRRQLPGKIKNGRHEFGKLQTRSIEIIKVHKNKGPGSQRDEQEPKRAANERQIKAALRKKDAVIKGIHHRFINHLNLIYNILYFQKQFNKDNRCIAILESIQKQIKAIALVHEHLQHSMDFKQVRFAEYLKSLLKEIMKAADRTKIKVTLKTNIESISIDLTTAVTCGLIVNELLGNSLKHAFPGKRRAEIFFGLQVQKDGTIALTVRDNGIGLPPAIQWHSSSSMGSFLVNTLTENLEGELTVDGNNGTAFHLRFSPLPH